MLHSDERPIGTVAVIGAGLMGAGIAHVAARAGLAVLLMDRDIDIAAAARDRIVARERGYRAKKGLDTTPADQLAALIRPVSTFAALEPADLAIEAVFEDLDVKSDVLRAVDAVLRDDALLGTNTSTIPISRLAAASSRPDRFIGLHFFSPVDRMPLLEVIRGKATSDATLASALGFATTIGMTPIRVNDSRGFYTTRIVIAYINEANELLAEGVSPDLIEAGARAFGMPIGPLTLCDEVALSLMHQINQEKLRDDGIPYQEGQGAGFLAGMVARGRLGRKAGGGYFDYGADGSKAVWPGLGALMPQPETTPDIDAVADRLALIQSIEALRCLDEGVLLTPEEGDIGARLGWGYPVRHGGPFAHVATIGRAAFLRQCQSFDDGTARFRPPAMATDM